MQLTQPWGTTHERGASAPPTEYNYLAVDSESSAVRLYGRYSFQGPLLLAPYPFDLNAITGLAFDTTFYSVLTMQQCGDLLDIRRELTQLVLDPHDRDRLQTEFELMLYPAGWTSEMRQWEKVTAIKQPFMDRGTVYFDRYGYTRSNGPIINAAIPPPIQGTDPWTI